MEKLATPDEHIAGHSHLMNAFEVSAQNVRSCNDGWRLVGSAVMHRLWARLSIWSEFTLRRELSLLVWCAVTRDTNRTREQDGLKFISGTMWIALLRRRLRLVLSSAITGRHQMSTRCASCSYKGCNRVQSFSNLNRREKQAFAEHCNAAFPCHAQGVPTTFAVFRRRIRPPPTLCPRARVV